MVRTKQLLSWSIVVAIGLYILGAFSFIISESLAPVVMIFALALGIVSAVVLVILLIRERLHDREVEKDDLSKY